MSDKNSFITSIIVGAVIALLGILTGLYIANNAHEQLAALSDNEKENTGDIPSDTVIMPSDSSEMTLPDLPSVEELPVIIAEESVIEDIPETTTVEVQEDGSLPDDFEVVTPEEIEKAMREQSESPSEP